MSFDDFDILDHPFLGITLIVLGTIFLMVGIVLGVIAFEYYYTQNFDITITQNEYEIYHGRAACVEVVSGGDTTQVSISYGFLCIWPKEYIVGRDIEVSGSR